MFIECYSSIMGRFGSHLPLHPRLRQNSSKSRNGYMGSSIRALVAEIFHQTSNSNNKLLEPHDLNMACPLSAWRNGRLGVLLNPYERETDCGTSHHCKGD